MSRKARKFLNQGNYLILPDLEILNAFSGFEFMPVDVLKDNKLRIQKELDRLTKTPPKEIANYYDDLCFVHYLQAVVCRMLYIQGYEMDKMKELHTKSLDVVFKHGKDLTLDHYVYFFSRYENARMLLLCKEYAKAETEINVVLKADDRGQYNIGSGSAKGKYSLASPLTFKCHNCMTKIKAELKAETESK
jgi:hypothetical protein